MDSKVLLFNERDEKVGDTYMRRARQLVNQQRATWVDDSHSAIRFAPDDDLNDIAAASAVSVPATPVPVIDARPGSGAKPRLQALAEKRIRERKKFLWHTLSLFPQFILLVAIGDTYDGAYFAVFLSGCAFASYLIHAWNFFSVRLKGFSLTDREANRARRLAIEMDKLKRMGYAE